MMLCPWFGWHGADTLDHSWKLTLFKTSLKFRPLSLPEVNIQFMERCHCWIIVTAFLCSCTLTAIFFKTCLPRLLIIEILKNFGLTVKKG